MSISENKVKLIGNLGQDPEISKTKEDKEYAILSVATSESYKDKEGNRQQKVEWHRVTVYTPHSVSYIKQYAKKGDLVKIDASLEYSKYTDKNGNEQYPTNIVVSNQKHDFQLESQTKDLKS